jgi:hypothetical protein
MPGLNLSPLPGKNKKLYACRGEGSAAGPKLRFAPAALLAMLRTALVALYT